MHSLIHNIVYSFYIVKVVEIKHLCNHYLSRDCEASLEMSECPTCHEVYPQSQIDTHIKANRCIGN